MRLSTDLLADLRLELDDLPAEDDSTEACLWSDDELYRYMNQAASATARRTLSYVKIMSFAVTADNAMIKMPEQRVLAVRRAYLETAQRELRQSNANQDVLRSDYGLSVARPDFETSTGVPQQFVLDYLPGYTRLYPIPTDADTLVMHLTLVPPTIVADAPLPFTDEDDLHLMMLYCLYRAYSKHDADTFNPTKARDNERAFEEYARLRNSEFRRQTRRPGTVRAEW